MAVLDPLASDQDFVASYLAESITALQAYMDDPIQLALLHGIADVLVAAMRGAGKLLIAGNGGSAGDAQHVAAEFTGRMLYTRAPLAALALTTDTSALTAIGNDFGFEHVFERQVTALGRPGDVLLVLSTSGNSPNVLRALDAAAARTMVRIGFTGCQPSAMDLTTDLLLRAPSKITPVVQQIHMVAAHIICSLVERRLFPRA